MNKSLFFLLALSFLAPFAAAQGQQRLSFLSYVISVEPLNGASLERIEAMVRNDSTELVERLDFSFGPLVPGTLKASVDSEAAAVEEGAESFSVLLPAPLGRNQQARVSMEFSKEGLLEELEDSRLLSLSFTSPGELSNFYIKVLLPEGAFIPLEQPGTLSTAFVSPEPSGFTTDGQKITVFWDADLAPGESFPIYLRFSQAAKPSVVEFDYLLLLSFIAALALFFAGIYSRRFSGTPTKAVSRAPKTTPSKEFGRREKIVKGYFELLQDSEKSVVSFLRNGQKTQAELLELTGFSKAKLSRILASMEQRNVVERRLVGRTNVVKLKNKAL
ncbi:MAG TPA: MarR family transcriptional regulator [archaeon]|nr:MarR family transcriptional regulator [archaeon]